MNTKLKYILISLGIIALGAVGFLGARYTYLSHTRIMQAYNLSVALNNFISVEFPEQVNDFNTKLKALESKK